MNITSVVIAICLYTDCVRFRLLFQDNVFSSVNLIVIFITQIVLFKKSFDGAILRLSRC